MFSTYLDDLKKNDQYRTFASIRHEGRYVWAQGRRMLNFSSNDYLGLAADMALRTRFFDEFAHSMPLTSSSSRLLTGNFPVYDDLEALMAERFGRACLLFNSGYHANIGILPALSNKQTLILADKLVHASLIDGILLSQSKARSGATFLRYRHNDYEHLAQLLSQYADRYTQIIIVSESVFSMDGDIADLPRLVQLKRQYPHVRLYIDEAHAIGAYGEQGLGMAEVLACIDEIDLLVGTFGKAMASMGAYVICSQEMKQYLTNTVRSLIFSTALPPINIAWTYFLFERLPQFKARRQHLQTLSERLRQAVAPLSLLPMLSQSCIVPYVLGDNARTVQMAQTLQSSGYYCLPIRPPTVPAGASRIRFSLTADMCMDEVEGLIKVLLS